MVDGEQKRSPKMIVAQVFDDDSGRALIEAMLKGRRHHDNGHRLPRGSQSFS